MTNPDQNPPSTSHGGGTRKDTLPFPTSKSAPRFDPDEPEELLRFIEFMEDFFEKDGTTGDQERKKLLTKYTKDTRTGEGWRALDNYAKGSYEDFKNELIQNYPEAAALNKGSLDGLRKKVKKYKPLDAEDHGELMSLIRVMKAELKKLNAVQPRPIHTNREIVQIFFSPLSDEFAKAITHRLGILREVALNTAEVTDRQLEDWFEFDEVAKVAIRVAEEAKSPYSKFGGLSAPKTESAQGNVKIEEGMAKLMDAINLQIKQGRSQEMRLDTLANMVAAVKSAQASGSNSASAPYPRANPASFGNHTHTHAPGNTAKCYYCGQEGHRMSSCVDVIRHTDLRWIKRDANGTGVRLPNGLNIPFNGNKTMKEVVESLNAAKPGVIPMSKVDQKMMMVAAQEETEDIEQDAIRLFNTFMARCGANNTHRLLQQTLESQDEAEGEGSSFY